MLVSELLMFSHRRLCESTSLISKCTPNPNDSEGVSWLNSQIEQGLVSIKNAEDVFYVMDLYYLYRDQLKSLSEYRTFDELEDDVEPLYDEYFRKQKFSQNKIKKTLIQKSHVTLHTSCKYGHIFECHTLTGAKILGKFTSWEFDTMSDIEFNSLARSNRIFIADFKTQKFLIQVPSVWNVGDSITAIDKSGNNIPTKVYVYILRNTPELLKSLSKIYQPHKLKHSDQQIAAIKELFRGRFKVLEEKILDYPELIFLYAKEIIKGPWEKGEEKLIDYPLLCAKYAADVLKGSWSAAEETILNSPVACYIYAKDAIKGKWSPGEEVILKAPKYAVRYAKNVLKQPWIEAEPQLKNHSEYWKLYCKIFKIKGQ